jgi:hypothetical protein
VDYPFSISLLGCVHSLSCPQAPPSAYRTPSGSYTILWLCCGRVTTCMVQSNSFLVLLGVSQMQMDPGLRSVTDCPPYETYLKEMFTRLHSRMGELRGDHHNTCWEKVEMCPPRLLKTTSCWLLHIRPKQLLMTYVRNYQSLQYDGYRSVSRQSTDGTTRTVVINQNEYEEPSVYEENQLGNFKILKAIAT